MSADNIPIAIQDSDLSIVYGKIAHKLSLSRKDIKVLDRAPAQFLIRGTRGTVFVFKMSLPPTFVVQLIPRDGGLIAEVHMGIRDTDDVAEAVRLAVEHGRLG